nr:unnamed protein product [Callosobruchus analis]
MHIFRSTGRLQLFKRPEKNKISVPPSVRPDVLTDKPERVYGIAACWDIRQSVQTVQFSTEVDCLTYSVFSFYQRCYK